MAVTKGRHDFGSWILPVFCFLLVFCSAAPAAAEFRTALVIGNGGYRSAPLKNPVNDATDMAGALRDLGFKVTLRTDAGQRVMEESIRAFGRKLRSGGVGLFYYAGHGIQFRGRNYLIPVSAEIRSEADIQYEAVDAGRVLAQMEEAENGLNIIILDACRNNPFARSFRSAEQGLAKMDAPTGSILAYSTAPGSVAADGSGRNGLYTEKLLKHLNTPGIDLLHLFMEVRREVVVATDRKQVPWESSSLIGNFYFEEGRGIAVSKSPPDGRESWGAGDRPPEEVAEINVPHPASAPEEARLAVFPFSENNNSSYTSGNALDALLEGIANTLKRDRSVVVAASYYDISRFGPAREVARIDDLFDASLLQKLYYRASMFSNKVPNLGEVLKIADSLDVDYVLMCDYGWKYDASTGLKEPLHVFLIDKRGEKVYHKTEQIAVRSVASSMHELIASLIASAQ